MIACFDVHYFNDHANAAAVVFENWSDRRTVDRVVVRCGAAAEYTAGEFYKRELEPLRTLIDQLDHHPIQTFVIDAYCHLSGDGSPGLGKHLYDHLPEASTVIGVAKNRFRSTNHAVELLRGQSIRPLFITAEGISYQDAADHIECMHGKNRFPTLLKMVDNLSRSGG